MATKSKREEHVHWKCEKCGYTYTNPIPITGMFHPCRVGFGPAESRAMVPDEQKESHE